MTKGASGSLTHFLGSELPAAVAAITPGKLLGRWPGGTPGELRRPARFDVTYYGEDHAHNHAELCLLLEGQCRFSFSKKRVHLKPGDMVLCAPNQPHAESYQEPGENYRLVWWILQENEPVMITTQYRRRTGFELTHRIVLSALPGEACSRLDWLRKTVAGGKRPDPDALREALFTITLTLFRRALQDDHDTLDSRGILVQRATAFVRAHASQAITLAEVAQAVRVSPNYLTSLFHAGTGMPLGRFILEERMVKARQALARPGASVKLVAADLGFADQFTFSRAFKRVTGRTPSQALRSPGNAGDSDIPL